MLPRKRLLTVRRFGLRREGRGEKMAKTRGKRGRKGKR